MGDDGGFDVNRVLEDGVISGCALRHLSEVLENDEREERALTGNLSMVCTYPEGYKERQSIYSCLTCQKETGQQAGICYACSENCHEGHDVVQLYTKRLFCCDCGNSKFKGKCALFEEKSALNRKNRYGHNFEDLYCICEKTYPPPENDPMFGAEMFQCFMCEDWFHAQHVNTTQLNSEDYIEMCCPGCFVKYPFISAYQYICEQEDKPDLDATVTEADTTTNADLNATTATESSEARRQAPVNNAEVENQTDCYYAKIKSIVPENLKSPRALIFHNVDWRPMLCRCENCKRTYEDLDCEFLLDEKDSVYAYLTKNADEYDRNRRDPQTELFDEIALRTNADVAHNAVAQISVFKREFEEFLSQMAQRAKVVTPDDVNTFFEGLHAKRRRLEEPEPSTDGEP